MIVLVMTCFLSPSFLHRWCYVEMGQGGPGNSPAPSGTGAHCLFGGEGLTAAYVRMSRGGVDCSLRTVHMSRGGYGWLQSVVFWFLLMRRLEEVVMTSLRTREGLSPAVSATPFVTSNHLVQVLQ